MSDTIYALYPVFRARDGFRDLALCEFANHIELAFECILIQTLGPRHKDLLYVRLRSAGHPPDRVSIDGRVAPTQDSQSLLADDAFQDSFTLKSLMLFDRQERHANGVLALGWQFETKLRTFAGKKLVRDLYEDTSAVSSFGITPTCTSMREVDEYLNPLANDLVILFAANASYKANAARIMLIGRIVKPLRRGKPVLEMGLHRPGNSTETTT